MCKQNPLKHFRTLEGAKRRDAMRAALVASHEIDFAADCHTLTQSQRCALADMAKAVSWRKSPTSPLSTGLAFFVYLSRGYRPAQPTAPAALVAAAPRRVPFVFGRGHA